MKTNIDKFKRRKSGLELETTSVFLETRHKAWLKKNDLNFSKLIREFLDGLMTENKEKES